MAVTITAVESYTQVRFKEIVILGNKAAFDALVAAGTLNPNVIYIYDGAVSGKKVAFAETRYAAKTLFDNAVEV